MASPVSDLREWIALLEREGELARIEAEVDPRGADEILADILGRLGSAYEGLAGLGRKLGFDVAD